MLHLDMGADHRESCGDDCNIIGKTDDRQHVRHGIEWHDEIGERSQDNPLGAQRRVAIDCTVIGSGRIAANGTFAIRASVSARTWPEQPLRAHAACRFTRQENFTDFHIIHDRRSSGHGYYMGLKGPPFNSPPGRRFLHGLARRKSRSVTP